MFVGVNVGLLYLGHEVLGLAIPSATLLAGEVSTVLRFLANDRLVFGHPRPTWRRCWQFHATVLGSFVLWALVTNVLSALGVHYLLASVAGNVSTVGWGLSTSFLWVWRPSPRPAKVVL